MQIKPELKISEVEFVVRAVSHLTKAGDQGIHFKFSGAWQGFKEYFGPESDPIKAVNEAVEQGKVFMRPSKGGVYLSLSPLNQTRPETVLRKMHLIE